MHSVWWWCGQKSVSNSVLKINVGDGKKRKVLERVWGEQCLWWCEEEKVCSVMGKKMVVLRGG